MVELLPCYTAVAQLGFKRHATATLKSNQIRPTEFGTAVARHLKGAQVPCDGTYSFSTRESNHSQMSLQRQHFHLSYFKTLSVGLAGFEPVTSCSADRCSPN